MSLITYRTEDGKPGLYAFLVGVSAYRYLPTRFGTEKDCTMDPLSAAAASCHLLREWLETNRDCFQVPYASCRILASPTADEQARFPGLRETEPATLANFLRELNAWRRDLSASPESVGLFYFAGHGVQRSGTDMVLLLDDFLEGYGNDGMLLERGVDFTRLYQGMAPSKDRKKMAARQFYFVDACRTFPSCFEHFEKLTANPVFDLPTGGEDFRNAPVFYSAIPGAPAYEIDGEQTIFNRALLRCLEGLAGVAGEEDEDGNVRFHVTVNSLNTALRVALDELNRAYEGDQVYDMGGHSRDAVILSLNAAPDVDVVLQVDPDRASQSAQVDIEDRDLAPFRHYSAANPHPFRDRWPAGTYTARVYFDAENGFRGYARARSITPPRPVTWRMKVV